MSYLEKLLDGAEVEWKSLKELVLTTSNIRWRDNDNTYCYIDLTSVCRENNSVIATSEINANNAPSRAQKIVLKNDVIFATTRPTQQRLCLIDNEYSGQIASTGYCILRAKTEYVLSKWIFFHLTTSDFKDYVLENQSGSAYPAISDAKVKEYKIPIPCPENPKKSLEIQQKIVAILDSFTELTAELTKELTKELTARKTQYSYYREQLFIFDEKLVTSKSLGELAENMDSMRKPVTGGLRESGNIPYYGASGIVDYVKDYIFDGDFLLVSEDGANLLARNTPIAFSISGKNWVNNHAHVLKFNTYAERRFVEYYLNSIDLTLYISGAAQPKLNQRNLNSIKIPHPTLEVKEKIVSILDKFDTLTTSISEGLPKEIALRKQQYEYYRDLLLMFKQQNV